MMIARIVLVTLTFGGWLSLCPRGNANDQATIERAETVLREIMDIPARRIPTELLSSSHGVAIIPSVIKIGFIGGIRRGHGVILTKDRDGDWGLPQFITLTGGSIGFQAGAQSTDVILVFRTAGSVENIQRGRFTIGVDAAAAAGPVGRNAAAATDAQMRAEILSYSRSRGLFAGVSLDGSALEINSAATRNFYGDPNAQPPRPVPAAAVRLMETVAHLAGSGQPTPVAQASTDPNHLRRELAQSARSLYAVLSPDWQRFLALPPAVFATSEHPSVESLVEARRNFDRVATDAAFANLQARPEFQTTLDLLREYTSALQRNTTPAITLPPPPPAGK
jgi:lipid-binding SYLF domain-containing protein